MAEALFGLTAQAAVGKACGEILQAADECGPVCSPDCMVLQAVRARRPLRNMDLQVQTEAGRRWCNVSVMRAKDEHPRGQYAVHVLRQVDVRKRLASVMRDFVAREAGLASQEAATVKAVSRAPPRDAALTKRELEVLRLLAGGARTATIAARLHLSRATVANHVQHVMRKLASHNRLDAVRRAELAGLI